MQINPLGEIIDCDDSKRILVGCQLEGADVVITNGVEGSFWEGVWGEALISN